MKEQQTYRNNHYVPIWYQERFFPSTLKERRFCYLDLKPETLISNGRPFKRNSLLRWGPKRCFFQNDLYTTKFGEFISTEIEENFFGPVDATARPSLDYFANFTHPSVDIDAYRTLVQYLSLQKLRTPKGLAYLAEQLKLEDQNQVLYALQRLQRIHCAIWSESIWSIADASETQTKFLISDHPVTVYNQGCFPASKYCEGHRDPEIWLSGTHTLFPLSLDKILILTNLSWVRHPYGNPTKDRPHSNPFRAALFNFTEIQVGRKLTEQEVIEINYIIKKRAYRYIAAAEEEWLYPERQLGAKRWDKLGEEYLLMPDPRSVTFSSEVIIGYEGGRADAFDAYGHRPWQHGYDNKTLHDREWETFHAFQGEFARRFGPRRRGLTFGFGRVSNGVDDEDFYNYHLSLEKKFKKHRYNQK